MVWLECSKKLHSSFYYWLCSNEKSFAYLRYRVDRIRDTLTKTHTKPSKYYCCWLLDLLFCYFFSLFFIMLFFPLSFDVASGEALMLIHCLIERNKKLWKIWEETVTWRRNRQHYRIQRAIVECLVSIKLNNSYAVCVSVCGDAVMEYLSVCIAHSTHGMDGRTRAWWTFTVFLYNTSNYLIHSHLFWPSGSGCHIRWTKMMFFLCKLGRIQFPERLVCPSPSSNECITRDHSGPMQFVVI